jgi:hypothetical protein
VNRRARIAGGFVPFASMPILVIISINLASPFSKPARARYRLEERSKKGANRSRAPRHRARQYFERLMPASALPPFAYHPSPSWRHRKEPGRDQAQSSNLGYSPWNTGWLKGGLTRQQMADKQIDWLTRCVAFSQFGRGISSR